jgi:hypothetical protein
MVLKSWSYVATSEVTALKHELRNDAVESRALVSESLFAGAESPEVLGSLGDYVVVQDEIDATFLLCGGRNVSTRTSMKNGFGGIGCQKV